MSVPLPGPASTDPVVLLAGCVAKEIGSALTSIQMAVDRLERPSGEGPDAQGLDGLSVIRVQTGRLSRLARQLLELGRPPSSSSVRMELNHEVERMLGPFRRSLEGRGVQLHIRPFPGEVEVCGDPHRLREALGALLGNAERAALTDLPTDGGTRWVEVRVLPGPLGGGEVRIRDSGPGVPEGREELIFAPFVSGWGGDGMGLPVSRLAAVCQGGGLELVRDPDGRCQFVVRLAAFLPEGPP